MLFFWYAINEWSKLDPNICSSSNYHIFRNVLLNFTRPVERKIFNISDLFVIKMLTRLRLSFSHFRKHKFRHGFINILNSLCSCGIEAETTAYYFLRCLFYNSNWATLMNDLENIPISFPMITDNNLISFLLYGNDKFDDTKNRTLTPDTFRRGVPSHVHV